MMNKFWNWLKDEETGERILRINGAIAEESWIADDVTPKIFRDELESSTGNIAVWLNSPGGDVFAASQIYTMLKDYRGQVAIKIDGLAASSASIIAMAGDVTEISPTGMMMIHNPETVAAGDSDEMKAAMKMLGEVKESIINAYERKTKLPRAEISKLMDAETWFNAKKAVELGFADKILFGEKQSGEEFGAAAYSPRRVTNSIIKAFGTKFKKEVRVKRKRRDALKKFENPNGGHRNGTAGNV